MGWDEFRAARLALSEQKVGRLMRADANAQDAAFDKAVDKLRKRER